MGEKARDMHSIGGIMWVGVAKRGKVYHRFMTRPEWLPQFWHCTVRFSAPESWLVNATSSVRSLQLDGSFKAVRQVCVLRHAMRASSLGRRTMRSACEEEEHLDSCLPSEL